MTDKQKETEEKIFEAARRVFQRSGYAGARMQEIADEADINKSMLHYYYRSKDQLFQKVFREGVSNLFPVIIEVLNSDLAFVPKIKKLVESYYDLLLENPHLPSFVIYEMHQHPDRFREFMQSKQIHIPDKFLKQLRAEIDSGMMENMRPEELMINIVSLCLFPFVGRGMIEIIFGMDDQSFRNFIQQRKKKLPKFILNAIRK